jgi:quinol monooxygenase YgiN
MKRIIVRYRTKPEAADANAELIAQVFAELKAKAPGNVRYLALRLQDDTFIHVSLLEAEDGTSPIPQLAAFRAFQSGIKDRCLEPPQSSKATLIGCYRAFGEA